MARSCPVCGAKDGVCTPESTVPLQKPVIDLPLPRREVAPAKEPKR